MHDDVSMGLIAGPGDGLHIILALVPDPGVLAMAGQGWIWAMLVPLAAATWWMLARRRRRLKAEHRAALAARIAARFPRGRVR